MWQALELARYIEAADSFEVLADGATFQRVWHARAFFFASKGRLRVVSQFWRLSLQGRLIDDLGERVVRLNHFLDRLGDQGHFRHGKVLDRVIGCRRDDMAYKVVVRGALAWAAAKVLV